MDPFIIFCGIVGAIAWMVITALVVQSIFDALTGELE